MEYTREHGHRINFQNTILINESVLILLNENTCVENTSVEVSRI